MQQVDLWTVLMHVTLIDVIRIDCMILNLSFTRLWLPPLPCQSTSIDSVLELFPKVHD
jgi:hypothetical protein